MSDTKSRLPKDIYVSSDRLPKNTSITEYLRYDRYSFGVTELPDGRFMVRIVYCLSDGAELNLKYDFGEGKKSGLNPTHIVGLYETRPCGASLKRQIRLFLNRRKKTEESAA